MGADEREAYTRGMNTKLNAPIPAGLLSRELGLSLIGPDREIESVCPLDQIGERRLSFVLKPEGLGLQPGGTVFAAAGTAIEGVTVIRSSNPRLDFIRAQHLIRRSPGFSEDTTPPSIHPSVQVGPNTVIENGVSIGEGTRVGACVVIKSGTRIGRWCDVKSGAVIGEPGFGFERDEEKRPLKMLHLGGVLIGDHVEIGSLTTVCRGALGDTVLEDYVKLDDHVHVAHNCVIERGAMITACAELSGSVRVGRNAWLAPNCSVVQKVTLGEDCFIGIGAVVARPVEPGTKVFGNPAKKIAPPSPAPAPPPA